jgi:hypothetical protein
MSNQPLICPNCRSDLTQAVSEGAPLCPRCGAPIPADLKPAFLTRKKSARLFWILLFSPAALSLFVFLLGRSSDNLQDTAVGIGLGVSLFSLVASSYCGWWLAVRLGKTQAGRTFSGFVLIPAIIAINGFIVIAGCAPNFNLH